MVKCPVFYLRAFLARFNASLLIRLILAFRVRYQQTYQQPDYGECLRYPSRYPVNNLFHRFYH